MILQALKEYYDRRAADPDSGIAPEGWEQKEIPFVIVIDGDGRFVRFEDTREQDGKKKRVKSFLVPKGEKKTSGVKANRFWDNAGYVLGVGKATTHRQAFLERTIAEFGDIESAKPMIVFLESLNEENFSEENLSRDSNWQEIIDTNPNLTFRLDSTTNLLCRNQEIIRRIDDLSGDYSELSKGVCLVSGQTTGIKRLHTSVKGVYGAQTAGANIVSFNLDAFSSYGKKQGENAPVGASAESAYTNALNTLLSKGSKQRIQIGDASAVFWSQKQSDFESSFSFFFKEPEKDNPAANIDKIKALFASMKNGVYMEDNSSTQFYFLGLSPNAARISIRFWLVGTIADFARKISCYFKDFEIVKPPKEPEFYSLWRILVNVAVQDKSENIPPNIAGDFMRAIIEGTPYPATLLQAALRRIRSDVERRVTPVRAALLKACLNRHNKFHPDANVKEVLMELDILQPSVGYQIGRLFGVLEKIQEEANPGINATIRERYYGSACSSPVTVFPVLLKLKNHHLAKLSKGRAIYFERILGEVIGKINDFPAYLGLHEQGRFAIGYYHQRQDFFKSKNKNIQSEVEGVN